MTVGIRADEAMWGAAVAARAAGVRTGLLPNSWGHDGYPRERFAGAFDITVISGEVGMRKPDPAIFSHAVAGLGVAASSCVLIDDFDLNIDAAREAGLVGMLHRAPRRRSPSSSGCSTSGSRRPSGKRHSGREPSCHLTGGTRGLLAIGGHSVQRCAYASPPHA